MGCGMYVSGTDQPSLVAARCGALRSRKRVRVACSQLRSGRASGIVSQNHRPRRQKEEAMSSDSVQLERKVAR
jgi:hypothetical protein